MRIRERFYVGLLVALTALVITLFFVGLPTIQSDLGCRTAFLGCFDSCVCK